MNNFKNRIIFLVIGLLFAAGSVLIAGSFENNSPPDLMKDYEILRSRIKQKPNDVAALNSLGIIYAKSGQLHDAIKIWKYALKIDRQYIHLYNNLGSALKEAGRKSEARIIFKTGLTVANSYWIYYNLGLLEKEEGNIIAAVNCFKKTLQLNPTFKSAINRLAELGHNVQPAPMNRVAKPLSLGSYKPPVGVGNIDLYPLYPDGRYAGSSKQPSYKSVYGKSGNNRIGQPFSPMTLASCSEIIKKFEAPDKDKYIALTFDDGPHSTHTPQILDILKKNAAKATFFVVGSRAEAYPDIVTRISSEGHALGNHSWSHKSLAKSDSLRALASLRRTNELLNGLTGKACNIVRPPYGHTSQKVKKLLHDQGWHEVMWDSDSRDWENKDSDRILYRVMKTIAPGSIVLFHDIHPGAAGMLPTLISAFKAHGYRFITIPELIKLSSGTS